LYCQNAHFIDASVHAAYLQSIYIATKLSLTATTTLATTCYKQY